MIVGWGVSCEFAMRETIISAVSEYLNPEKKP
jgi:hypothetical protein